MLSWVIQSTVISIIFIFLIHHLINFFKSTLTVPKIKDLVTTSNKKYENMYNIIQNNLKNNNFEINNKSLKNENLKDDYTLIDLLPTHNENTPSMKDELKDFLKKQFTNSNSNNNIEEYNYSERI
jgi:hypothetical protein